MILDTSAILAILFDEPDAERHLAAIARNRPRRLSVANYVEAGIRLARDRRDPMPLLQLDRLIQAAEITLEPVTAEHGRIALDAYRDFGKGSGHPAQLNFGDCFAYDLARSPGEALLFKGEDFGRTDVPAAL